MAALPPPLTPGICLQLRELKALRDEDALNSAMFKDYRSSALAAHAARHTPAGAAAIASAAAHAAAAIAAAAPPPPPPARKATAKRCAARQSIDRLATDVAAAAAGASRARDVAPRHSHGHGDQSSQAVADDGRARRRSALGRVPGSACAACAPRLSQLMLGLERTATCSWRRSCPG
jgi:hypothetical protein